MTAGASESGIPNGGVSDDTRTKNNDGSESAPPPPATRSSVKSLSTMNEEELEVENSQFRQQLASIQNRRRTINRWRKRCEDQRALLEKQYINSLQHQRQDLVEKYIGTQVQLDYHTTKFTDAATRWSTINDCFFIWHTGPSGFATINGCRLGSDPLPIPPALLAGRQQQQQQQLQMRKQRQMNQQVSNRNSEGPTSPSRSKTLNGTSSKPPPSSLQQQQQWQQQQGKQHVMDQSTIVSNHVYPGNQPQSLSFQEQQQRVPWNEVNAALGHMCLLLKVLQETSITSGNRNIVNNNFSNHTESPSSSRLLKFTHELYPIGSTSKIGIRFYNPKTVKTQKAVQAVQPAIYNLYYEESTGLTSLFRNDVKNFNFALQAFCQCVAEMAAYMHQTDKTISMPHDIRFVVPGSPSSSSSSSSLADNRRTNGHHMTVNGGGANASGGGAGGSSGTMISYPFQNVSSSPNSYCFLNGGEWTVGGLSICYPQTTADGSSSSSKNTSNGTAGHNGLNPNSNGEKVEWTRACKYLLTDLKWIVASTTKHVDT